MCGCFFEKEFCVLGWFVEGRGGSQNPSGQRGRGRGGGGAKNAHRQR